VEWAAGRSRESTDTDRLLEDVRRDPGDDRARSVYGDALQERGDPRGELIALQLASADGGPRARALITKHGRSWLGPLAAIASNEVEYRRGFPVEVTLDTRSEPQLLALVGAAEWFSIERLRFIGPRTNQPACAAIVRHSVMQSLREVRGLSGRSAWLVANADPPLALTVIGVDSFVGERLSACAGLPALRRIEIEGGSTAAEEVIGVLRSPVAARLDSVTTRRSFSLERATNGRLERLLVTIPEAAMPLERWRSHVTSDRAEIARLDEDLLISEITVRGGTDLDFAQRVEHLLGPIARLPRIS
jgi:uncharacterized protein (TIGR02996 family)